MTSFSSLTGYGLLRYVPKSRSLYCSLQHVTNLQVQTVLKKSVNVDWLCLCLSHLTGRINVVIVIGRNNGVVGLTAISNKRMCGLLFGPQKSGRIKGVVVWRGSTVSLWAKNNID